MKRRAARVHVQLLRIPAATLFVDDEGQISWRSGMALQARGHRNHVTNTDQSRLTSSDDSAPRTQIPKALYSAHVTREHFDSIRASHLARLQRHLVTAPFIENAIQWQRHLLTAPFIRSAIY